MIYEMFVSGSLCEASILNDVLLNDDTHKSRNGYGHRMWHMEEWK